ncbi:MAG: glycosyltransferase family 2 protein [Syntrophobacteraceae bacterium]|nr:glycosyltransferase family 2 protein [Syntrophobacteraceae bacterium]
MGELEIKFEERTAPREKGSNSCLQAPPRPVVSVIVPTYKEVENLPFLIGRLRDLRRDNGMDLEVLIMDDDSRDGTREYIASLGEDWVRLFTRTTDRGLSRAVCDGLKRAEGDVIVVMDADLSHPPEAIPALVQALEAGHDFALGSRYVAGGSTHEGWGVFRWLNSKIATLLAKPFSNVKDPMSGFFALLRSTYERAAGGLNPVGYKIGLELMVKCRCRRVKEIPFHFCERQSGESKLSLAEQARYIKHIRRLFIHKYGTWSHLAQFLVVGGLGTVINLATLSLLLGLSVGVKESIGLAIAISMGFNFVLNRRFTFDYARSGSILKQLFGYVGACSLGALCNYIISSELMVAFPALYPQLAVLAGIAAGVGLNFIVSLFAVFKPAVNDTTSPAERSAI